MPDPTEPMPTGALRPIELASASVLAGVAVVLVVVGSFLPNTSVISALATVPFGLIANRHRLRPVIGSAVAAGLVSVLVAGTGCLYTVAACAVIGTIVGAGRRRRWSFATTVGVAALVAPVAAGLSVGTLAALGSLRRLVLAQVTNTWNGLSSLLLHLPGLAGPVHAGDRLVHAAVRDWWLAISAATVVGTVALATLAWIVLGSVLERLQWVRAVDRLDLLADAVPPGPLPLEVRAASYRYPGAAGDALHEVSLAVGPGELVVLLGDNGSGKSTLARLLAGRSPTGGRVERPGGAGLGRDGGTALVMQRPESQVLGVRVADDVVWGLADAAAVDVAGLLATVGLSGFEDRETSTLSGGELQRLAVASALARRPRLLISDESTAMVDADGRQALVALLADLPARHGVSVVHVTHRHDELPGAARRLRLAGGRVVDDRPRGGETGAPAAPPASASLPALPLPGPAAAPGGHRGGACPALEVRGLRHTYGAGTPWAQPALAGIDLAVERGAGLLVVGGNGSGKSTLAWAMAGLLRPTGGVCLVAGVPVLERVGAVGLAFQHARLQLQRPTVREDVAAAGAAEAAAVERALAAVGLDPAEIGPRRVDELSGGQQRRVALAGLLTREPEALILDEPFAGLDEPGQEILVGLLRRLRAGGLTVVVISHDLAGMDRVCDRAVHLDAGRVVRSGAAVSVRP